MASSYYNIFNYLRYVTLLYEKLFVILLSNWHIYCDIDMLYLSTISHTPSLLQFSKTKFIFKKSNGQLIGMYFCF